jgi:hypothetical protein
MKTITALLVVGMALSIPSCAFLGKGSAIDVSGTWMSFPCETATWTIELAQNGSIVTGRGWTCTCINFDPYFAVTGNISGTHVTLAFVKTNGISETFQYALRSGELISDTPDKCR